MTPTRQELLEKKAKRIQEARAKGQTNFWRPKVGKNIIRILPHWSGSMEELPYRKARKHFGVGPGKQQIICRKSFDPKEDCPICEDVKLKLVSYVFGHRLPASGRCVGSKKELARLATPGKDLACYVIEVCPSCSWNHLAQAFSLSAAPRLQRKP